MTLIQFSFQITTEGGPIGDIRGTSMVQTDAMYQVNILRIFQKHMSCLLITFQSEFLVNDLHIKQVCLYVYGMIEIP